MASYYLDSSAVVKRYVDEAGSGWVRSLCEHPDHAVLLSELALVEVSSAFARRQRRGELSVADQRLYLDLFIGDCVQSYQLIPVERMVIDRAVALVQQYGLRAYDAVQLASALVAGDLLRATRLPALTFVAADAALLDAAAAAGLAVEGV
jgi:hypothetical protein